MRAMVLCAVLCLVAFSAGSLHAQEAATTTITSPTGGAIPDSTTATQPGVPSSPSGIQHGPLVESPTGQVPSPVVPSEPPTGYAPEFPPGVPQGPTDFLELTADSVHTTYDESDRPVLSVAEGNGTSRYRDVVATAQRAQVDHRTNIAVFEGNVVLRQGTQDARGKRVTLNLRTREWTGTEASTTVTPQFAQGWLRAPLFAEGTKLQGFGRRQVDAYATQATTCNLSHPHYEFVAKSLTVYPDNKIILRNVSMYALGRKIFTVPRFVIPLRQIQRNPSIIPRLGQNDEEGFFLKTAYSWLGSKTMTGFVLLDLMSKKGVGTGLRHIWTLPNASGEANVYQLHDQNRNLNTLTGRITHSQLFGTVRASISSDFRSNSYLYSPQSKTLVNRLTLTRDRYGANTSLNIAQNVSSLYTRTQTLSANLQHKQLFGRNTSLDTSFDYTGYRSTATQARLTSQMLFNKSEKKFDWSISAQKLTDLSDEAFAGQGIYSGVEKLPEIGLVTDTTRAGKLLPFDIPLRLKVTNGQYTELSSATTLNRTFVEATTPVHRFTLSDTWRFNFGAGFRQYLYSDNTAQYSADASAQLSKRLGPTSSFDLSHRLQMPRGYAPFRFDYIGKYNITTASLNYQDSEKLRYSILTGYNFEQPQFPWQDITLRVSFQPTEGLLFYTATAYNLNHSTTTGSTRQSQWRTLINQVRIRRGDAFRLDVGTRYDTALRRLSTGRLVLDAAINPLTRLQAVMSYNGATRRFDYSSVSVTRDLHCWEASVAYTKQTGFYESQGVSFYLRIKAFPFYSNVGQGQYGQALGADVGDVY